VHRVAAGLGGEQVGGMTLLNCINNEPNQAATSPPIVAMPNHGGVWTMRSIAHRLRRPQNSDKMIPFLMPSHSMINQGSLPELLFLEMLVTMSQTTRNFAQKSPSLQPAIASMKQTYLCGWRNS
jgi:hypothetical protein